MEKVPSIDEVGSAGKKPEWTLMLKACTWGGAFGGLVFGDTVLHISVTVNLGLAVLGCFFGFLVGSAMDDIFGLEKPEMPPEDCDTSDSD